MRKTVAVKIVLLIAVVDVAFGPIVLGAQNTATARFSVATADGYVHDALKPQNVRITRDGQPRRVVSVQSPDAPLSIAILLENVPGLWDLTRYASPTQSLGVVASQDDWLAVLQYGNGTPNFRDILMDFTKDRSAVSRLQLVKPVSTGSSPKLFDAIKDATSRVSAINGRKALVVLTDGCDASQIAFEDLARQIKTVPQLTISVVDFGRAAEGEWKAACLQTSKQLSAMAAATNGGYSSIALTSASLEAALQTIAHTLHNQYLVTYLDDADDAQHPPAIALVDDAGNPYNAGGKPVNVIAAADAAAGVARQVSAAATPSNGSATLLSPSTLLSDPQALRFAVAHQHLFASWCFGYLYVTPDVISYVVSTPPRDKNHSFTFKRSQMTWVGPWSPQNAVEIKFGKVTYHFWWMPDEQVAQTGRAYVWNPPDAADPQQLIAIIQNPAAAASGTAPESAATATAPPGSPGSTNFADAQAAALNSGGALQSPLSGAGGAPQMLPSRKARGHIGIRLRTVSPPDARSQGLSRGGVVVQGLEPGGPAEQAGVRVNDLITAVNGVAVGTSADLQNALVQMEPGSAMTLQILRGPADASQQPGLAVRQWHPITIKVFVALGPSPEIQSGLTSNSPDASSINRDERISAVQAAGSSRIRSTAPPDTPPGPNSLSGVYAGIHFGYGPGATATGEVRVFAFYPDGTGMYLPEEGLDNFNLAAAARAGWEPVNYGRYQCHDNHVDFRSQDGTAIGIDIDQGGSAPGLNAYMQVCHCNGMRFGGTYNWGDRSMTITFFPDGRFLDKGAMHDAFQYSYYANRHMVDPGIGTYRVVDYTIYLDYSDGRHLKQSFIVLAPSVSPRAVWIRGATFNRLQ